MSENTHARETCFGHTLGRCRGRTCGMLVHLNLNLNYIVGKAFDLKLTRKLSCPIEQRQIRRGPEKDGVTVYTTNGLKSRIVVPSRQIHIIFQIHDISTY